MKNRIGKNIERDRRMFARDIDVVNGPVEGRVGIHRTSVRLNEIRDFASGPFLRALEKHMFEEMGKSRSEMFAFMNAPGFHPNLNGSERRAVFLFKNDNQAVRQNESFHLLLK